MVTIKCNPKKFGCGMEYEVEKETVKTDKHLQCPHCGRVTENPLWDGTERSPVGVG